jgi:hypothetical protein
MEDMLSEPTALPESSDEAKAGDESKEEPEPEMMEEEPEVKTEPEPEVDTTNKSPVVKAPEPNSAFKSFFNSNVSLEALEAETAASKKQRETVIEIKAEEEIQISSKMPQTSPNLLLSPRISDTNLEKIEPSATVVSKSDTNSDDNQSEKQHFETSSDLSKSVFSEFNAVMASPSPQQHVLSSPPTKEIVSNISSITSTLTTFSTTQVSNNADNLGKVGLGVDVQKMVQKFESSTTTELCKPAATITPTSTHDQNT